MFRVLRQSLDSCDQLVFKEDNTGRGSPIEQDIPVQKYIHTNELINHKITMFYFKAQQLVMPYTTYQHFCNIT